MTLMTQLVSPERITQKFIVLLKEDTNITLPVTVRYPNRPSVGDIRFLNILLPGMEDDHITTPHRTSPLVKCKGKDTPENHWECRQIDSEGKDFLIRVEFDLELMNRLLPDFKDSEHPFAVFEED